MMDTINIIMKRKTVEIYLRTLPTVFEKKAKNSFKSMSFCNEMLYTAENHCPTMYHRATIGLTIQHPEYCKKHP